MKFMHFKTKNESKNSPVVVDDVNKKTPEEVLNKKRSSFFGIVFENYRKFKSLAIPMLCLVFLSVACSISLPLLTQQMSFGMNKHLAELAGKEWVDVTGQYWGLEWYVSMAIAIGITFANMLVMYVTQFLAILISVKIEVVLRQDALIALVNQDISYYSDKKIGEILTKVISDTQIVGEQSSQVPTTILQAILTISGTLGMMFYFEWHLALVVIGVFVILLSVLGISFGIVHNKIKKVREVLTDVNGQVTDRINNIRLVKSTGTEKYESKRFKTVHQEYQKESTKMAASASLLVSTIFGGIGLLQLGVVASAMLIYQNKPVEGPNFFMTTFASFTLAQGAMIGALFMLVNISIGLAKGGVASNRIKETINAPSLINPHNDDGELVTGIEGNIIFDGVAFAYPEKPNKLILPKFDFVFEKGKSYAFVGETGSGKSTISKLLLRYYDPTEGNIFVNDKQNLKTVALSSYLDHVGYVEQEPSVLYGDVFENVRYGSFEATEEEVINACKKAELHELIMGWQMGYKTILGEHGFMLSGGQKQRLIIARMFLKNPQVLILDEATSALDNIVEKEIQAKLDELMQGRTTITIAHRLSTIKNVDQIIVLGANGVGIVQRGSFDELRQTPGHFKNLYEAGLMQ